VTRNAGTHADHIDGTESDLVASAQAISIDMDDLRLSARRCQPDHRSEVYVCCKFRTAIPVSESQETRRRIEPWVTDPP
jgi:hypothetical protein